MQIIKKLAIASMLLPLSALTLAEEDEVQDMSDPTAVYSQGGVGITNKGLNFKYGQAYDTGNPITMGMNLLEVMGVAGEALGWDSNNVKDNSIDSFRFRNFSLDLTNGRGTQIDVSYNVDTESGTSGYSFLQALPKMGMFQFYPLAGAGLAFANNAREDDGTVDSGYSIVGTYLLLGMYSKVTLTDNIWLNYNPFYTSTLSGSNNFKNFGMEGDDAVLTHEFSASYQINPRMNVRYFANWSENVDVADGNHRIEMNYQF